MAFSDDYFAAMALAAESVREASLRLYATVPTPTLVRRWFVMTYQVARATCPLLLYAAAVAVGSELEGLYYRKAKEERGHDKLLLQDLFHADVRFPEEWPTNPFVAEMVGRQYYLVDCIHPAVLLGYLGLLEGTPMPPEGVDALQVASGYGPEVFRTLRLHSVADLAHRAELAKALDATPNRFHLDILGNGIRCAQLHAMALNQLTETPHARASPRDSQHAGASTDEGEQRSRGP